VNKLFIQVILFFLVMGSSVYGENYKIGVLSKRGKIKCLSKWVKTAEYLTKTIKDDSFEIVSLKFEEVFPSIENKTIDFFLVNSSMFITAKVKYGAKAIMSMVNSRQGNPLTSFGGVIFTSSENEDINRLEDLRGNFICAVKESSFGGWQMALKEFKDNGIEISDFKKLMFLGKHDNVVFSVDNGDCDVGTVRTGILERLSAEGSIKLTDFKIISKKHHASFPFISSTALYPEWPLAKIASTDASITVKVQNALRSLKAHHVAARTARIVGWQDVLDYTPVEDLQKELEIGAYQ